MQYFLFIFLASALGHPSSADTCFEGIIRIPSYTKTVKEKSHYCYTTKEAIYSPSCKELKNCIPNLKVPIDQMKPFSYGTPGSRTCISLKGQAQVIEYLKADKQNWVKTSRCVFKDKGFVDTELLLKSLNPPQLL